MICIVHRQEHDRTSITTLSILHYSFLFMRPQFLVGVLDLPLCAALSQLIQTTLYILSQAIKYNKKGSPQRLPKTNLPQIQESCYADDQPTESYTYSPPPYCQPSMKVIYFSCYHNNRSNAHYKNAQVNQYSTSIFQLQQFFTLFHS